MYKLCFYVPENDTEIVKQALFDAGAGRIGLYDHCCWQTLGTGQFRPLAGSTPHLGEQDRVETLAEYKVEMVCDDDVLKQVIRALRASHPYEEPAFDVCKLVDTDD